MKSKKLAKSTQNGNFLDTNKSVMQLISVFCVMKKLLIEWFVVKSWSPNANHTLWNRKTQQLEELQKRKYFRQKLEVYRDNRLKCTFIFE
jgi:hypothetical protein